MRACPLCEQPLQTGICETPKCPVYKDAAQWSKDDLGRMIFRPVGLEGEPVPDCKHDRAGKEPWSSMIWNCPDCAAQINFNNDDVLAMVSWPNGMRITEPYSSPFRDETLDQIMTILDGLAIDDNVRGTLKGLILNLHAEERDRICEYLAIEQRDHLSTASRSGIEMAVLGIQTASQCERIAQVIRRGEHNRPKYRKPQVRMPRPSPWASEIAAQKESR